MSRQFRVLFRGAAIGLATAGLAGLAACSSSNDDGGTSADPSTPPPSDGPSTPSSVTGPSDESVIEALLDFPDAVLPRFTLGNDEVTADEAFRRIDVAEGGAVSWGVEGVDEEETIGIEVRYAPDGTVLQTERGDLIETLPGPIEMSVRAIYPDAPITEIERVTIDGTVSWTVLLDVDGVETEPNFSEDGTLLFTETGIEPASLPAPVAAVFERVSGTGGAALPAAGYERLDVVDGTVFYSVEFEDDDGRSLTVETDEAGTITRVEHEDSLENLSASDTVEEALADYPPTLEALFAADYPEVEAIEIFRFVDRVNGGATRWGIEGASEDETLEIEAIYLADGELLELVRDRLIDVPPADVAAAFAARYPGGQIEEVVESMTDAGTSYAIVFLTGEEEREANFDASGAFLELEDALEESEIPEAVLASVGAERVLLPIVEFEAVDAADGTRRYDVEYENEDGESISYALDAQGAILSVEHEGGLPR